VRLCGVRLTRGGSVAVCLAISVGGVVVEYNVYLLKKDIELRFYSTDRSRAELAARLLKLAGVNAEVRKAGVEGGWRVIAGTDLRLGVKSLESPSSRPSRGPSRGAGWARRRPAAG
jgi:hypothetical protein